MRRLKAQDGGTSEEHVRERRVARREAKAAASRTGVHVRIRCEGNIAGAGCLCMSPPACGCRLAPQRVRELAIVMCVDSDLPPSR